MTSQTAYFVFSVKTCRNAQIALPRIPGNTETFTYIINIESEEGHTTLTYLDSDGTEAKIAESSTPDLLHCDSMREFWIKWENSKLEFGRGAINGERLISMADMLNFDISSVAVSTGDVTDGEWEFVQDEGTILLFHSN